MHIHTHILKHTRSVNYTSILSSTPPNIVDSRSVSTQQVEARGLPPKDTPPEGTQCWSPGDTGGYLASNIATGQPVLHQHKDERALLYSPSGASLSASSVCSSIEEKPHQQVRMCAFMCVCFHACVPLSSQQCVLFHGPETLSAGVCVCVCVCMYVYMCVCIYIYIYICLY